jgi:hypothetical protein
LVPKADYFGEQISTKKLLSTIKEDLRKYDLEDMFEEFFEEIKNYIIGEERDSKLENGQ